MANSLENGDENSKRTEDPHSQDSPQAEQIHAADSPKPPKSTGIPKGVYRFKTLEEADEWTSRMLARKKIAEGGEPPPST